MTKEEAIKELERAFDVLDHTCHMNNRRKEAFNMARVGLFTEPCEDCISRKGVISQVEYVLSHPDSELRKGLEDTLRKAKTCISIQPKTDVLDKIRAEIEEKARPNEIGGRGNGKSIRYGLCMALQIIDKYKAEKE